jgi:hypothetical protein
MTAMTAMTAAMTTKSVAVAVGVAVTVAVSSSMSSTEMTVAWHAPTTLTRCHTNALLD